jgi:hypothetical protein
MDDSGQLLQLSLGHRIAKRSELYSEPARVGNIIDPQTLIGRVELQFRASLEAKVHECKNNLSTLPSNAFYWDLGLADGSSTHLYMFSFRGPTSPEELARMAGKVLQPQMKLMEKLVSNRDQVFLSYSKGMCYRKVIGVSPSSGSFCNNPITGDIPTGIEERLLKVECPLDRSRLVLEK